jgi:glycosyltransferase involved in cell wall biosynthesis
MQKPDVSVVIPTVGRPTLLQALESALAQEQVSVEVLICAGALECDFGQIVPFLSDRRVRVVHSNPGEAPNGNTARQNGINLALGDFVALLDDDDFWEPTKLRRQLDALVESPTDTISACRCKCLFPNGKIAVWPKKIIKENEGVADYLFRRTRFTNQRPLIQTSTIVARREVFMNLSFEASLPLHQDWDWLIRAQNAGSKIIVLEDPLSTYRVSHTWSTASRTKAQDSMDWVTGIRHLISPRAHAEFIAGVVNSRAIREKNYQFGVFALRTALGTNQLGYKGFLVAVARTLLGFVKAFSARSRRA